MGSFFCDKTHGSLRVYLVNPALTELMIQLRISTKINTHQAEKGTRQQVTVTINALILVCKIQHEIYLDLFYSLLSIVECHRFLIFAYFIIFQIPFFHSTHVHGQLRSQCLMLLVEEHPVLGHFLNMSCNKSLFQASRQRVLYLICWVKSVKAYKIFELVNIFVCFVLLCTYFCFLFVCFQKDDLEKKTSLGNIHPDDLKREKNQECLPCCYQERRNSQTWRFLGKLSLLPQKGNKVNLMETKRQHS